MSLNELMALLAECKVTLDLAGDSLAINAPKGVLSPNMIAELKRHKHTIIASLKGSEEPVSEERNIGGGGTDEYDPFAFSDLQMAFYMAADPHMEYHVQPHYYVETDAIGLDTDRYQGAVNKAIQHHRGGIVTLTPDGRLSAMREIAPIECKINDFRGLSAGEVSASLLRLRELLKRQELPLDRWPWFDLQFSVWNDRGVEKTRIHMNHNNFYTDGFSGMLLQQAIDRFYDSPELTLPALQLTYRNALLALDAHSQSGEGRRAQRYWLDRFNDLPEAPALPQVSGRQRRCRSQLQRRENYLPAGVWTSFKQNASHVGLTPTSAILSAYAEILCLWSGSAHFILSNMVTRRLPLHPEMMDIIGNFASLYPLEVDLRGNRCFAEKAQQLQRQILRDADHRAWGGMQVMQALNRLRGEPGTVPCPFVVGSGLFLGSYKKADFSCLETAQTMLDHQFWELDDGRYYYVWDVLEEFFPSGMMDAMWEAFEALMRDLATDPALWTQTGPLRPPKSILDTSTSVGPTAEISGALLHQGLAAMAKRSPKKTVIETGAQSMSYQELDRLSNSVAASLLRQGVRVNEFVAVVIDRSPALLAATLGILKAGAAFVPIDAQLPIERIHYMLRNSRARIVVTDEQYHRAIMWPDDITLVPVAEAGRSDVRDIRCRARADNLAYLIYTSGSTGTPKGVMIDHRGALNTIRDINDRFQVGPHDKVLGVSSFGFDLSVYDVFGVLQAGATLVYPEASSALNPADWLNLLASKGITIWNSAPALMSLLVDAALRQEVTLAQLRLVMLSGDWIPIDLPDTIKRIAPNAVVVSLGGATEASIWSIFHLIDEVDPYWKSIPYGRPLTNQGWKILDAVGRPVPVWTVGELYIAGVGVAQGYWGDEEATRRNFVADPVTGERLYRTGDRGRFWPDGNIEFMGRIDTQVKIQGHRIELGEIEMALGAHPLLKEAAVLAVNGPEKFGVTSLTPARQLLAFVVFKTRTSDDALPLLETAASLLQDFLRNKLPGYMIPDAWVILPELPISSNGKIDRRALSTMPRVIAMRPMGDIITAPRNHFEIELAAIWRQVLQKDEIDVHDDFFVLGGHSFDAVRCVGLIKERLGQTLTLGDIWKERSIANLALRLDAPFGQPRDARLFDICTNNKGRPYIFVHPGGGQILGYRELGKQLDRPSYGLVALTEDADGGDLSSVALIAARYIDQLKKIQSQGPYTLAGWSSGGCIAFEMAAQLEEMNELVDQLVLIDCPAPTMNDTIEEAAMLRGFFEDLNLDLPLSGIIAGRSQEGTEADRFSTVVDAINVSNILRMHTVDLYGIYRVFSKIVAAVRNYRPSSIKAKIILLRAADGVVTEFLDHPSSKRPDWGWEELTSGRVYVETLSGTHHTLLRAPNVDGVARAIMQQGSRGRHFGA